MIAAAAHVVFAPGDGGVALGGVALLLIIAVFLGDGKKAKK